MVSKLTVPRHGRGYTIIEVMVAVILLAIALPGLVVMVVGSRKVQTSSVRMDQASGYGQLVLDSLGLIPSGGRNNAANQSSSTRIGNVLYTARWSIPAASGGAYMVPVTIEWSQGNMIHNVVVRGVLR